MELVPVNKSNLRIGKIEINYNTFSGTGSPGIMGVPHSSRTTLRKEHDRTPNRSVSPTVTSIFHSTIKSRTVEQIYTEKLTPMSSSSRNLLPRGSSPSNFPDRMVIASKPVFSMRRPAGKPFNRTLLTQKRLKDDRLKVLNLTTQRM